MEVEKPNTRINRLKSLKHHIVVWENSGWEDLKLTIFDGTEGKTLQSEDTLKMMIIDDLVMEQVDEALAKWKLKWKPLMIFVHGDCLP